LEFVICYLEFLVAPILKYFTQMITLLHL
jgi:hypothetical protein